MGVGIMMMLDLGETRETISATTGFSRSTVDRRIKLLNIDGNKFKDAETRGATLEEYLQVAEIEDRETRDKLTDAMGTNNFRWMLAQAVEDQVKKQKIPLMRADMKRLGVKEDKTINTWDSNWNRVLFVEYKDYESGCADDKVSDAEKMRWNESRGFSLYKPAPKKAKVEIKKSDEEIHANELRERLAEVTKKAYDSRVEFVSSFSAAKKYEAVLNEWCEELLKWKFTGWYAPTDHKLLGDILGIEDCGPYNIPEAELEKALREHPGNGKLAMLIAASGSKGEYYDRGYGEHVPKWQDNEKLNMIYEYLEKLGYEMSDEEKALQDGTHELFEGE